jgi:peptidoglycan/LPS O-acetylase OafA/YrhL
MFAGTTLYRAEHRQIPRRQAVAVVAVVSAALLTNWFAELQALDALTPRYLTRSVLTLLVFGGAFAVGMACRHRRVPRWLAWIGVVSYSVYLLHVPLIQLLAPMLRPLTGTLAEIVAAGAFLALLLALSWLTHRYIEVPSQRLGHRAARPRPVPPGDPSREPANTSSATPSRPE